jgi:hypothetical protein
MKLKVIFCWLLLIIMTKEVNCQGNELTRAPNTIDYVQAFKDTLAKLSEKSGNEFFKMHCNSIASVINSASGHSFQDTIFLKNMYQAFNNQSDPDNAKKLSTYLERRRPFILSWVSPTDGSVSFSWLNPPKNWNPDNQYPLYIQLHGLWYVASNAIEYMTYPFTESASNAISFEDGYLLSPWGRGNYWYEGISETDIWECIAALEAVAKIDPTRKYLSGHSMGGYGAWRIASKSPDTWAALGIHAGALWFENADLVNATVAAALKNVPTYFVCGTDDGLLDINLTAYHLLEDAGNAHLQFATFEGGHVYLENNVEDMYLWMRKFVNEDWTTDIKQPSASSPGSPRIRCYPNPVTTTSTIVYSGIENSAVDIAIYDICGQLVDEVAKSVATTGENRSAYDASGLKPGVYVLRLKSGDLVADTKMVVEH